MRAVTMLLVLLATPAATLAGTAPRFSGSGALVAAGAISADGRYALHANLERGDGTQHAGRFSMQARLAVSDLAKATTTVCNAGTDIFRNGFE